MMLDKLRKDRMTSGDGQINLRKDSEISCGVGGGAHFNISGQNLKELKFYYHSFKCVLETYCLAIFLCPALCLVSIREEVGVSTPYMQEIAVVESVKVGCALEDRLG